jgi:hypothetical protein
MAGLVRDFNTEYGTGMPKISYADYDNMYSNLQADPKSTLYNPTQSNSGFGLNTETLGTVFSGLNALSGLANAYLGFKNYSLAKKQFGFEKAAINRNIANQAKIINNAYDNAAQVAAGMVGGRDAQGNFGYTDPAIVERYAKKAEEKHVDGNKVG